MNLEETQTILETYGMKLEEKDYFVNLSMHLANSYYNFFNDQKIDELYQEGMSLDKTKLKIYSFFPIEKDRHYLRQNEIIKLKLEENSYIVCDSTGQVHEFIIQEKRMRIQNLNILEALYIANQYHVIKKNQIIIQTIEKLELLSAIYHFAFLLLNLNQGYSMDIVRTGMFHNAYFHLIHLCEHLKKAKDLYLSLELENVRK